MGWILSFIRDCQNREDVVTKITLGSHDWQELSSMAVLGFDPFTKAGDVKLFGVPCEFGEFDIETSP
jgi:hypothetical protein